MYFEGPEKKLEIGISRDAKLSLRNFDDLLWNKIVSSAGAKL